MSSLFGPAPGGFSAADLNPAQQRAVMHGEGPLLVIAGAGTGKTKVIIERIRFLLETDSELSGENILGLTFTDKAAGEMKRRVVDAVGERGAGVTLATFHSFCQGLLQELDPERVLLDKVDQWILLRRNMARLKLEKFRRLSEPGRFLDDFVDFFSRCQDELVDSGEYQRYAARLRADLEAEKKSLDEDTIRERSELAALQEEIARVYAASEELLREKKRLTFGALIAETVARLREDAALRERLQERYRHILVDEFQDTNIAQLELLDLLSTGRRNIVAVGDNDQAIYRFRGASFGSFTIFLKKFAGWKPGEDASPWRVTLTENYRSMAKILRVATEVIAQNEVSENFPKKILSTTRGEGERVRVVEPGSAEGEARWIRSELQRLHAAGHAWRDFAILYRQHSHRDELVAELARAGIPFFLPKLSILTHPLVRDVLAYLRLVARPFDDISCARVLGAPAWGLEAEGLARLTARIEKKRGMALHDVLQAPQGELAFGGAPDTRTLVEFLGEQRKTMRRKTAREIFGEMVDWLEVADRADEESRRYVERLSQFVKEWEPKSESRTLPEFLEYLDYYEQAGGKISLEDDGPRDAVRLMTVHGAKGLEFPHVFILRMNAGAFPVRPRPHVLEFPEALMKEERPEGDFHIQEERRLFYVALTRARDRLTLTSLTDRKSKRSPFLDDFLMNPAIQRRDVIQLAPDATEQKPEKSADAEAPRDGASLFPASTGPPRIFSRIAQWAESYRPPTPEPLQLSPSAIDNYRGCPQRYLFSRLWQLPEGPRAALSFGNVMHTVIKRTVGELRKGNALPFAEVARIFEVEWRSAGFEDDYQEGEYKKDGLEQLRVFHESAAKEPAEVLEQEKSFELPLENNVVITGRMDQINSLGRRDVEIVDYKTGKPKTDAEIRKDLQLSLYALAAREVLELNPKRLVLHFLLTNERRETTREAKQLDEAVQAVQETAADIRAGEFPAKPGYQCKTCAYRAICPAHEEVL